MRLVVLLSLLLCATPTLHAQGGSPPFFPPDATLYAGNAFGLEDAFWPDGFAEAPDFRDVRLGDVDGDDRIDAVVLSGSTLVLLPALDSQTVLLEISVGGVVLDEVTAFALVESDGVSDLVVSDASGTRLLHHQLGGSFTADAGFGTLAAWADLRQLVVADQGGDGLGDLFGLSAAGIQVLRRVQLVGAWAAPDALGLPLACEAIAPVGWDSDASLEIGAVCAAGLLVLDDDGLGGAVVYQRSSPWGAGVLAAVSMGPAGGNDRLVWVFDTGVHLTFCVADEGGFESTFMSGRAPSSLRALDLDGDGDSDLVMTGGTSFQVRVFEHQGVDLFDPVNLHQVVQSAPDMAKPGILGNLAPVDAADVDEDGIVDLCIPSAARGSLLIATGGPFTAGGPQFVPAVRRLVPYTFTVCQDPVDGGLNMSVTIEYENFPAVADGWRVSVWLQEEGALPPLAASASTCSLPAVDLNGGSGTPAFLVRFRSEALAAWGSNPTNAQWSGDERLFHIKVEPVTRLNPATALDDVARGAPLLASMSFDLDALALVPVSDDWIGLGDEIVVIDACESSGAILGGQPIGGFYSVKRIPSVVNEIPVLTDACLIALGAPGS